jgi:signal transduction histidine kinase
LPLNIVEEVAEIFATMENLDQALGRFLGLARSIAGSPFGAIYLYDQERSLFARWAEDQNTPSLHLDPRLVKSFLGEGGLKEISLDSPPLDALPAAQLARSGGVHWALALPLFDGQTLMGVLALGLTAPPALSPESRRTLEALARFPSTAIRHAHTRQLLERRANLGVILSQFGERALATVETGALHRLILDTMLALTGSDQASLTEIFGDRERVMAGVGKDERFVGTEAPITAMAAALEGDAPEVVRVAIPMRHGDRVLGHLFAGAPRAGAFPPEDVEAMRILAAMAAAVIVERLAQQAKDRFVRIAAHELRTPVTALYATTQLLQIDPSAITDATRRATLIQRVERQSGRLKRLVEQLLDSARLGMSEVPLSLGRVELVSLCRDVLETMVLAGGPRITLRGEGPIVGQWDGVRLEQLLANLLSNALRYTPPDGEVVLEARIEGERALLLVSDSGIGIPAAEMPHVFEPFFRAGNVGGRTSRGLGLGLHLAYEIARRHDGDIKVESTENVGTTFTVSLPL